MAPCEPYSFAGLNFGEKDAQGVWANWKIGNMLITFLFGAANVPLMLKHLRQPEDELSESAPQSPAD